MLLLYNRVRLFTRGKLGIRSEELGIEKKGFA